MGFPKHLHRLESFEVVIAKRKGQHLSSRSPPQEGKGSWP